MVTFVDLLLQLGLFHKIVVGEETTAYRTKLGSLFQALKSWEGKKREREKKMRELGDRGSLKLIIIFIFQNDLNHNEEKKNRSQWIVHCIISNGSLESKLFRYL